MDGAKQNLHVVEPDSKAAGNLPQDDSTPLDHTTEISSTEKKHLSQIYQHEHDSQPDDKSNPISRAQLVNILNYINFQDDYLLVNFKHPKYAKTINFRAKPQPCAGESLDCTWQAGEDVAQVIKFYRFSNFLISRGKKLLKVYPELLKFDENGISVLLPETSYEVSSRKIRRHSCENINVQLIQNSGIFKGSLLDFSAFSFKVALSASPPQTFEWIDSENTVNVILSERQETLYSGECRVLRQTYGQRSRNYVLEPLNQEIQRYRKTEYRSDRQEFTPTPNIIFQHPLTKKRVDLKVVDLSGSGFSVEEDKNNPVLLPGMILPELELNFANSFKIACSAQVVFRKSIESSSKSAWVKCGLALLDLAAQDHVKLIALLHQAKNKNSYICNNVDLDSLWNFFFETGFIYPDKYALIHKNKSEIKATYDKLYMHSPGIARHFIYQDKGDILGHMAMVRFYNKSWLIHHHAARKSALNKAGLVVLDQISRFIYDSYRLCSMHMEYVMCYYRPDNKFPNTVFGGAAKKINNPKGVSEDLFAYLKPSEECKASQNLPEPWQIVDTCIEDLEDLENFYEYTAGGLMLRALDLEPGMLDNGELAKEYQQLGFKRDRHLYSLKQNGRLKAVIIFTISDIGLNLSDLTNCIKAIVVDPDELTNAIFFSALSILKEKSGQPDMPVLLYPTTFADDQSIDYEKQYKLWVFRTHGQSDKFFKYLNRLLRYI